jgi:hypothetical protein
MKLRLQLTQLSTLFVLLSLLFVVSCTKEKSGADTDAEEQEVSKTTSEADADAETIFSTFFDDVIGVSDDVGMAGVGIFGRTASNSGSTTLSTDRVTACFTVTITHPQGTPFPARVVIDFGPIPCMGPDGHTRKGKIISEYTNRLTVPGAIAVTTFDGFYFDSIHVEGTHKTTNTSTVNTGRQFKVEVINGKLTWPNGNYTLWNSVKNIKQIEGMLTPDFPRDDVFQVTGSAHGRAQRGNLLVVWESNIVEPLIKRFLCRWIVKGTIKTVRLTNTTTSPWVAILNFGNGQCDNHAVITINGVSHQITLP